MGIPKFYRWLSERYPLINQPMKLVGPPQIDNLYLDMNGVIHNCSHGAGTDHNTRLTEEEMMVKVFNYLDHLVQMMQPQKLLYMAIDGVAPRAKMNQQRSRRFRSARDAIEARAAALRRGEPEPEGEPFDSNCITPGTEFMARLSAHLHFFVRKKQTEDAAWQRMRVILSGHDVRGEGEHKIMEHIRMARLQPDYAPNQRHCMYGLDADLIMLALVTHEPHFTLLREVVTFGAGGGQPSREVLENPSDDGFQLLHVCLLRDYLDAEFRPAAATPEGAAAAAAAAAVALRGTRGANSSANGGCGVGQLPFPYDLERIIDDFVFIVMLVGNDFLPPLPTLDIAEGALNTLMSIYKEELPSMGGYVTDSGVFDPERLGVILQRVAELEGDVLAERAKDASFMADKKAKRAEKDRTRNGNGIGRSELDEDDAFEKDLQDAAAPGAKAEASMMRSEKRAFFDGGADAGVELWREAYYREKLEVAVRSPEKKPEGNRKNHPDSSSVLRKDGCDPPIFEMRQAYVEGLVWVLEYYYRGVASWGWFYPFHYAPMARDLTRLGEHVVDLSYGRPFRPFEQLLAVLPAASGPLLPAPFRKLMTDPHSPILDFYPADFRLDNEGKRNEWEGVVLVPFIDEARLLQAVASVDVSSLSKAELDRNEMGFSWEFVYEATHAEEYPSSLPKVFSGLFPSRSCAVAKHPLNPLPPGVPGFRPVLVEGTKTGVASPPGFPSLRSLKFATRLQNVGAMVFSSASRKESLILSVADLSEVQLTAAKVAPSVLGQRCFVQWPYVQEAVVMAVSDARMGVTLQGSRPLSNEENRAWEAEAQRASGAFLTAKGIDLGQIQVMFHVHVCTGLVRHPDGSLQKKFSDKEELFPVQVTLRKLPGRPDLRFAEQPAGSAPPLPPGSTAVFLGVSYFGARTEIVEACKDGTYLTRVFPFPPDHAIAQRLLCSTATRFEKSGAVARKLRLSPRTLGQITGSVYVRIDEREKVDVGLNLKNAKAGLCVPDYCRPTALDDGWEYSDATAQLLALYQLRAPWLFQAMASDADGVGIDGLSLPRAFPGLSLGEAARQVYDLRAWLKKQAVSRRPLVKTGSVIPPEDAIRALAAASAAPLALKPEASVLAGGEFGLGDRVVHIGGSGGVPFGLRGYIVGVHSWEVGQSLEVLFESDFIGGTDLHGRIAGGRGALLPSSTLLNLSHPPPLPDLGKWAPPQRSREKPKPAPPASGKLAWEGGPLPKDVLAAARMALPQIGVDGGAPGTTPPPPPGSSSASSAAAGAAATAAAAAAVGRRPAVPPPNQGAETLKAPVAAAAAQAAASAALAAAKSRPDGDTAKPAAAARPGSGGGRGSGPSNPEGSGFNYRSAPGRGRGAGQVPIAASSGKGAESEAQEPAEPEGNGEPAALAGKTILAMIGAANLASQSDANGTEDEVAFWASLMGGKGGGPAPAGPASAPAAVPAPKPAPQPRQAKAPTSAPAPVAAAPAVQQGESSEEEQAFWASLMGLKGAPAPPPAAEAPKEPSGQRKGPEGKAPLPEWMGSQPPPPPQGPPPPPQGPPPLPMGPPPQMLMQPQMLMMPQQMMMPAPMMMMPAGMHMMMPGMQLPPGYTLAVVPIPGYMQPHPPMQPPLPMQPPPQPQPPRGPPPPPPQPNGPPPPAGGEAAGRSILRMIDPAAGSPTVAQIEAQLAQAGVSSASGAPPAGEEEREREDVDTARELVSTGEEYAVDEGLPLEDAEEESLVNE